MRVDYIQRSVKMNKPSGCIGCPLYNERGPLLAQGSPDDAKFIYILDQPSHIDFNNGQLLSGSTGAIFNRQLYDANIYRREVFITCAVKCECTDSSRLREAREHCNKYITREIQKCSSDVVVLAGQDVFQNFIGTYSTYQQCGISYNPTNNVNTRLGCVEQKDGRKWIGIPHPSEYMRNPSIKDEIVMHLKKAKQINAKNIPLPRVHTGLSRAELTEYKQILSKDIGAFADDVETFQMSGVSEDDYVGGDYTVDLAGYSIGPYEALVIKPEDIDIFKPLYSNPALTNYQHNGMYDQFHIARLLGHNALYDGPFITRRHQPWMDGMLAAHYHKSYKIKYLKPDCLSRYTTLPYYDRSIEKVDRKFYNGLDVMATYQECETLTRLLKEQGSWEVFNEIGMRILPILEEQRIEGVRVDARKALLFRRLIEWKLEESQRLVLELCEGEDPSNPHVLKRLLYDVWSLPKQYAKHTSKLTSDFDSRQKLIKWINHPKYPQRKLTYAVAEQVLNLVDFFVGERKKLEYLDRISPDVKIHAYYKAHGAWSFRLSSTPNLQNFPVHDISNWGGAGKDTTGLANPLGIEKPTESFGSLRSMLIADTPDDLILSIDYAQMQLWIYAELSDCKWLKQIRDSGEYLYGVVYEKLFNKPFFKEGLPRIKANKRKEVLAQLLRSAKTVPLGFIFGRTGEAVAAQYGWTSAEGVAYRSWFFKECAELEPYHKFLEEQMKRDGYLKLPYGNVCWFPDRKVTDALNAPAQSTEALMLQESVIMIDEQFKARGWFPHTRVMLTVHDSISINVYNAKNNPQHLIEVYEHVVNPILSRPNPYLNNSVAPYEAEVSYMWDWDTTPYDQWKEQVLNAAIGGTCRTNQDSNQSSRNERPILA